MVKAQNTKSPKSTGSKGRADVLASMRKQMVSNPKFRDKALLNTANRWNARRPFNGDLTCKGLSETKKSFNLAVDGVELKSKYVLMGTEQKPFLVSGRAIAFASKNK